MNEPHRVSVDEEHRKRIRMTGQAIAITTME